MTEKHDGLYLLHNTALPDDEPEYDLEEVILYHPHSSFYLYHYLERLIGKLTLKNEDEWRKYVVAKFENGHMIDMFNW